MDDPALQTRLESFMEALLNTLVGFGINFTANMLVLPHFGFTTLTLQANFVIGIIYTLISVVRGYAIRRWAQAHMRAMRDWLVAQTMRLT